MKDKVKHWTHYRWNEGDASVYGHIDFSKYPDLELTVPCVSERMADFVFCKPAK